jgi:hypothetical protein
MNIKVNWMILGEIKTTFNTHSAVTRPLLQITPSHGAPHGSFDAFQLDGKFCHPLTKDKSAATDNLYPCYYSGNLQITDFRDFLIVGCHIFL